MVQMCLVPIFQYKIANLNLFLVKYGNLSFFTNLQLTLAHLYHLKSQ